MAKEKDGQPKGGEGDKPRTPPPPPPDNQDSNREGDRPPPPPPPKNVRITEEKDR